MDISGAIVCSLCVNPILLNQPRTDLLCSHSFHTECALMYWVEIYDCPGCRHPLFTPDIIDRANEQERQQTTNIYTDISMRFQENKDFRKDILTLRKQISNLRKAKRNFIKYKTEKRRLYKQDTQDLIKLLKQKQKTVISEILNCEVHKQFNREKQRMNRLINLFERKYDNENFTFHRILKSRACKLPTSWQFRSLMYSSYWRHRREFPLY